MINNDAVVKCVHDAADAFHSRLAKLGATEMYTDPQYPVTCTLFGYSNDRNNQIIEVKLGNTVIDKLIITNRRMKHRCNFRHVYGVKSRISGL
uniref:Uncharacterized protein n=1 Tax=Pantoea phage Survivor TaxID=3232176 RepID=A0AAU8L0B2_9CAUD